MKANVNLLRPNQFNDYIGQNKLKEKLAILIESAQNREDSLDHILLYGPPGLGKTTIARVISNNLQSNMRTTSGPVIDRVGDMASILMSLKDRDILFIDEIHRLNRAVEELLYSAMEDRKLDLVIGKGPTAKSVEINLAKFTLIGATTNASLLTAPLRDRFGFVHRLEYYGDEDLFEIVKRNSKIFDLNILDSAAINISKISRGTPRIANRFLKRIRDFVDVNGVKEVNEKTVDRVLHMMDVDNLGLESIERDILKIIVDRYSGGPVGIEAIATVLGENRKSLESIHEPYLVKLGLMERTRKGRKITEKGYKHIKDISKKS
ncbi:MAG TPA: Holliday junction branch migration DNA helicase RuvB [Fusobacteria bacterium]|nr:Holliday junction branch migration DNA helicase RuvB [Fusobacteriota bacterium]|tara:strand:- start:7640 stop:8602 length:963 start_codon:yes stop_codon:yes gene_type:complete